MGLSDNIFWTGKIFKFAGPVFEIRNHKRSYDAFLMHFNPRIILWQCCFVREVNAGICFENIFRNGDSDD